MDPVKEWIFIASWQIQLLELPVKLLVQTAYSVNKSDKPKSVYSYTK